jgi:hypothetical protein
MLIPRAWVSALTAVILGAAAHANAAPTVYSFVSGQADITVTTGTTTLAQSVTLQLDGIFATFDDVAPALTDFTFTTAPDQMINLSSAFGGYDDIVVHGAAMTPGAGYTNLFGSQIGPNTYQVAVAPVVVNGVYSASNSAGPPPPPVSYLPIGYTNTTPLVANIDLVAQTFFLEGITIAELWVPGEAAPLVVKADLTFQGFAAVPEPATIALVLVTMAAIGGARIRAGRHLDR